MVFVKTKLSAFNDIEEVLMRYFSRLAWSCWTQLIIIIVVLIVVVVLVVHVLKRLVLSALVEPARQDGLVDRWDVVVVARGEGVLTPFPLYITLPLPHPDTRCTPCFDGPLYSPP